MTGNDWQKFGTQAVVQGECCGAYRLTFGARGGPASNTCGVYMYSEILTVKDAYLYFDNQAQTTVGYLKKNSVDDWTERGTWISYNDKTSIKAVTQFISKLKFKGNLKKQPHMHFSLLVACFVCRG